MVSISRRVSGSIFVGYWYLPLTSQNPYPIKIHFVAITDPVLVTFGQMRFSQLNYVSFFLYICFIKPLNLFIIK